MPRNKTVTEMGAERGLQKNQPGTKRLLGGLALAAAGGVACLVPGGQVVGGLMIAGGLGLTGFGAAAKINYSSRSLDEAIINAVDAEIDAVLDEGKDKDTRFPEPKRVLDRVSPDVAKPDVITM